MKSTKMKIQAENARKEQTSLPSLEKAKKPAKRKRESEPNKVKKKSRERGLENMGPDEQSKIRRMSQR